MAARGSPAARVFRWSACLNPCGLCANHLTSSLYLSPCPPPGLEDCFRQLPWFSGLLRASTNSQSKRRMQGCLHNPGLSTLGATGDWSLPSGSLSCTCPSNFRWFSSHDGLGFLQRGQPGGTTLVPWSSLHSAYASANLSPAKLFSSRPL